jgi:hypothetical protein
MKRAPFVSVGTLGLALAASCTPTPNILPSNDFNRPMDITFMCLGAFGVDASNTHVVSGRPMGVCHPPPAPGGRQMPPGAAISSRTFAFVPNSASGDLSVIDADSWKIVDLDKATGGFGRAPLGALPEQISSSSDGCRLVSANRGACDLTIVNPSTLLASKFAAEFDSDTVAITVPKGNGIQHVRPIRDNGTYLDAAPYEVVFLPTDTSALSSGNNLCPADGGAGSWLALATFPGCDLVALLDLPSGNILSSAHVEKDSSGRVTLKDAGKSPACVAECGGGRAPDAGAPDAAPAADGGTPDDGGSDGGSGTGTTPVATRGTYSPTSIAITPTANHVYISLANASVVLSAGLTTSGLTTPQNTITLHENAQGSNRIRLGVDPNLPQPNAPGFSGRFVGDMADPARNYLYVVARDGSLRIVDATVPGDPTLEVECETNFDPLANMSLSPDTRCIPYGTVKRRQYSIDATAGLRFPTPVVDVAAADMTTTPGEQSVNGGYAWVLTANSNIYLVNITPQQRRIKAVVRQSQDTLFPLTPEDMTEGFIYKDHDPVPPGLVSESPPFPNRPRDRNVMSYSISLDPTLGPTRLDVPPVALVSGPYIEPFYAQGTEDNATALTPDPISTYVFFPDREGANAQGWDVTWEGTVVSPRYSGIVHGTTLRDDGGGFCSAGVLAGDIVTLRGCSSDTECPLGMVCHRDATLDQVPGGLTVTGLCVPSNNPSLDAACGPYVSTVRRYDVVEARESALTLKPHLDEIVRSSLTPCRLTPPPPPPPDCPTGTGGTGGMTGAGGAGGGIAGSGGAGGAPGAAGTGGMGVIPQDCLDLNDPSTSMQKFSCVDIGPQPRCLMPCTADDGCRSGRVCQKPACASVADCPNGTSECKDGICFTSTTCGNASSCTMGGASCLVYKAATTTEPAEQRCAWAGFCADGPPLGSDGCFPQLTSYQVNVNAGFHVTGTSSGLFDAGTTDAATGLCRPYTPAERDPRLVSRIPLRPVPGTALPVECGPGVFPTMQTSTSTADGYFIDHFDPLIKPGIDSEGKLTNVVITLNPDTSARPEAPQLVEWMKDWTKKIDSPNACIYMGGPIVADTNENNLPSLRHCRPQHVRARFRNTQIAFVLANIDRAPSGGSTIHFEVHGGFRQQAVVPLPTVEISAPARLVLGPFDSIPKDAVNAAAANYFFVVDQRRLGRSQGGGPTRGQIVRVSPFGLSDSNGSQPIFEDYQRSGGLFPIQ